jgi:hypothetical protein
MFPSSRPIEQKQEIEFVRRLMRDWQGIFRQRPCRRQLIEGTAAGLAESRCATGLVRMAVDSRWVSVSGYQA